MFERCIYFNTNALARKLNEKWQEGFARFGLSPSHGYLLRLVLASPGLSQQAIAAELRLEKSTIARFVGELERQGYAEKKRSENDTRQNAVFPTAKARAIESGLNQLGDELYELMRDSFGEKELQAFVETARQAYEKL